jgi:hypothetical protein
MDDKQRRPGFTIPGYAAAAARKGHELKTCHEWTAEEAREQGRRAAAKRWGHREEKAEAARW